MTEPSLPPELVDFVIDQLRDNKPTLSTCTLVSKTWLPRVHHHLFVQISVHDGSSGYNFSGLRDFLPNSPHLCLNITRLRVEGAPRPVVLRPGESNGEPRIKLDETTLHTIFQFCPRLSTLVLHTVTMAQMTGERLLTFTPSFPLHKLVLSKVSGSFERVILVMALFTNIIILEVLEPSYPVGLHSKGLTNDPHDGLSSHLRFHSLTVEGGRGGSAMDTVGSLPSVSVQETLQELDLSFETRNFTSQIEDFCVLLKGIGPRLRVLRIKLSSVDLISAGDTTRGQIAWADLDISGCTSLETLDVCIWNALGPSHEDEKPEFRDSIQQFDCLVHLLTQDLPETLRRVEIRLLLVDFDVDDPKANIMPDLSHWFYLDSALCGLAGQGVETVRFQLQCQRSDAWCSRECTELVPPFWQEVIISRLPSCFGMEKLEVLFS